MKLSSVAILSIAIASATASNSQASPKASSAHDEGKFSVFFNICFLTNTPYLDYSLLLLDFDKPTELKTKLMRGGDISLRTDAENTETTQLLKLVKDLAGQVEDMKAELLVQKDYVKTISTVLNIENVTDLDAEIARVAEEVYESHAPPNLEPPQDDPSAEGPPGVNASGLELSASTGLNSGDWCWHYAIDLPYGKSGMSWDWKHLEHSAYFWAATDPEVNWNTGCDKCPSGTHNQVTVSPYSSGVGYWFKCA